MHTFFFLLLHYPTLLTSVKPLQDTWHLTALSPNTFFVLPFIITSYPPFQVFRTDAQYCMVTFVRLCSPPHVGLQLIINGEGEEARTGVLTRNIMCTKPCRTVSQLPSGESGSTLWLHGVNCAKVAWSLFATRCKWVRVRARVCLCACIYVVQRFTNEKTHMA